MSYVQVVYPDLGTSEPAGWCLKFVQDAFRAPKMHATATIAANSTEFRSHSRQMPNVSVPVWFWHYGTYNGVSGEYGHVVIWVPGRGFLSSPTHGVGQKWLSSIEEVERTYSATYRFWSQDINTLRVATPSEIKEKDIMPKTSRVTYRPKTARGIGKAWTYLTINDKGDVTVLSGGAKGRHAQVYCNLDAQGAVDVRAVVEQTSPDGKSVLKSNVNYYARINRLGTYSIPLDIPEGFRLRFQARAVDAESVPVGQMGYVVDYWEK